MIPFASTLAILLFVLLVTTVLVAVHGHLLTRRLEQEGLLANPRVRDDPRVRLWATLPRWLGAAAIVLGTTGYGMFSEFDIWAGTHLGGHWYADQIFDTIEQGSGLLFIGCVTAAVGLASGWRLAARVEGGR
jgi:hypothetical protein